MSAARHRRPRLGRWLPASPEPDGLFAGVVLLAGNVLGTAGVAFAGATATAVPVSTPDLSADEVAPLDAGPVDTKKDSGPVAADGQQEPHPGSHHAARPHPPPT